MLGPSSRRPMKNVSYLQFDYDLERPYRHFPTTHKAACRIIITFRKAVQGLYDELTKHCNSFFFFFLFLSFYDHTHFKYGDSQATGPIGTVAAGLCHSHSNAGSGPRLQPTPRLTAMLDPQSTEKARDQTLILMDARRVR